MAKVCKSDGQETFAGTQGNGEVAPIPVFPLSRPGTGKPDPELTFMTAAADGGVGCQADIRTGLLHMLITSLRQLVEQRLRLFEVGCVEAFGEPAVDRREKFTGLNTATLVAR